MTKPDMDAIIISNYFMLLADFKDGQMRTKMYSSNEIEKQG